MFRSQPQTPVSYDDYGSSRRSSYVPSPSSGSGGGEGSGGGKGPGCFGCLFVVFLLLVCSGAINLVVQWFRKPDAQAVAASNLALQQAAPQPDAAATAPATSPAPAKSPEPLRAFPSSEPPAAPTDSSPASNPAAPAGEAITSAVESASVPPSALIPSAESTEAPSVLPDPTPPSPDSPLLPTATLVDRQWTSADGRSLRATLRAIEGDKVRLQVAPGSEYSYPVDRLSVADRVWLFENFQRWAMADVKVDWELRTWTSAAGRFKTQGVFLSQTANVTQLLRGDGSVIEVEKKLLSAGDRSYLAGK